jgi:putative hydrolase of HD superfamily
MAWFLRDEFPEADMDKVIHMLLIHDLGEAFTGDIPVFDKTQADEDREEALLNAWVDSLPEPFASEMHDLYAEMEARESLEAKIYKAIDGMEAVIQHNESPLDTWVEREYTVNLNHAMDKVSFSPYLTQLRQMIREDTLKKIETEGRQNGE